MIEESPSEPRGGVTSGKPTSGMDSHGISSSGNSWLAKFWSYPGVTTIQTTTTKENVGRIEGQCPPKGFVTFRLEKRKDLVYLLSEPSWPF